MIHFALTIYSIVFTTLAGILSVAVIVMGYFSWPTIIAAMITGALLALPTTYTILKQMDWSEPDKKHEAKKDRWYIR